MMSEPLNPKVHVPDNSEETGAARTTTRMSVTPQECQNDTIPLKLLETMFNDSEDILKDNSNIVPVPGTNLTSYYVLDIATNQPRQLKINRSTKNITCESKCHRWNSFKMCCHIIALSEHLKILDIVMEKYKALKSKCSITDMVNTGMSSNRGKKGTTATQIRKGKSNKPNTELVGYTAPTGAEKGKENNGNPQLQKLAGMKGPCSELKRTAATVTEQDQFELTFIHGLIKKCYGCESQFGQNERSAPFDVLLKHPEVRPCYDKDNNQWYLPMNMRASNAYYHLNKTCVQKIHSSFSWSNVIVPVQLQQSLTNAHKNVLKLAGINVTGI